MASAGASGGLQPRWSAGRQEFVGENKNRLPQSIEFPQLAVVAGKACLQRGKGVGPALTFNPNSDVGADELAQEAESR